MVAAYLRSETIFKAMPGALPDAVALSCSARCQIKKKKVKKLINVFSPVYFSCCCFDQTPHTVLHFSKHL